MADERNFHCWQYRRYVAEKSMVRAEDEFAFSTEKIHTNFSNYSAFHHRSWYIEKLGLTSDLPSLVESEFELLQNAIFTEPDDQSAWWYHQFLLTWTEAKCSNDAPTPALMDWFVTCVNSQVEVVRSLLEVEENSKWALVTLANLLHKLRNLSRTDAQAHHQEYTHILQRLCQLDPIHIHRYTYLLGN